MIEHNLISNTILDSLFRWFRIESIPNEGVDDIKRNLLKLIIYILNILGIPVILVAMFMAAKLNEQISSIVYLLFYMPIFIAYLLRNKARSNILVYLILLTGYIIGLSDLLIYGISGLAIPIFLTIFVISSIFLNVRNGLISILVSTLSMSIFGYLFINNLLSLNITLYDLSFQPVAWVSVTLAMIFLGSIIIISFGFIQQKMMEKIITANEQAKELEIDINNRKVIERNLQIAKRKAEENQLKFIAITNQTSEGISLVNLEGNYLFVNPVFCKMTGYSEEELLRMNVVDLRAAISDKGQFKNSIGGDKGNMIEIQLRRKDNSTFWAEITGKEIIIGDEKRALGVVRDISDRKLAELNIKISEERLSLALEGSVSGIWDWNIKTSEIYFDANYFRISGYEPHEFEHAYEQWKVRVHPDDIDKTEMEIADYINGNTDSYQVEFRFKKKDGNWMWILGRGKIFEFDEQGKPVRFTGTHTDITSSKLVENALIENREKLKETLAIKDKFFSIISHDLKNPLGSISGFTELLANKYEEFNDDEKKKAINSIKIASKNSFNLLENLLEWSRIQTGSIEFKPEKFDITKLINDEFELFKLPLVQKQIKLKLEFQAKYEVIADKNMISTIIRNLLSNALKFTPQYGSINVELSEKKEIEKDQFIEISVADSGVGMASKQVKKLFNIDESYSTKGINGEKGTGLGLILCKEFIDKHGGEIIVESEIGKGSRFIFTLKQQYN